MCAAAQFPHPAFRGCHCPSYSHQAAPPSGISGAPAISSSSPSCDTSSGVAMLQGREEAILADQGGLKQMMVRKVSRGTRAGSGAHAAFHATNGLAVEPAPSQGLT